MRHSPQIRAARPSDVDRLTVLAAQVWLHTYATDGINGEIAQYVLSELTVEKFLARLREPETSVLVAEHEDSLVGFSVVRFGASCPSSPRSTVELQTLYIQEHFIGHGIGRSLLQAAEAQARERSATPLWLTVNAQNARAIAFYARQGYNRVGTTYFVLGESRHENHVLIGGDA
jgi:ribosomal protein S18 acetylase RimI-like enzyme